MNIVEVKLIDDYVFSIKTNNEETFNVLFVQAQKAGRQIKSVEVSYKHNPLNPEVEVQFKRHPGYYYYSLKWILDDNDNTFKVIE